MSRGGGGPGGQHLYTFKVEGADKVSKEFKEARKTIRRDLRQQIITAGTREILPYAKQAHIPPMVRPNLVVRASGSTGYITVKGSRKLDRILGLNQYGGRLGGTGRPGEWIKPTAGSALAFGGQHPVALVKTVRIHEGSGSIKKVILRRLPAYTNTLNRLVMQAFDGLEHTP